MTATVGLGRNTEIVDDDGRTGRILRVDRGGVLVLWHSDGTVVLEDPTTLRRAVWAPINRATYVIDDDDDGR